MRRILIADDHDVVRRGLKSILAESLPSLEVVEAANAKEALSQFEKLEFDLALLDVNMPGRSGLEVLEEIRRHYPRTPVLVLSAYSEEDYAFRSLRLGAAGYLTKQSAADELTAAVQKVMGGGKYVTASLAEKLASSLGGGLSPAPHEALSHRELQVLKMIAQGQTLKEVASTLSLSEKTVGTYRTRISQKMGLRSNIELTRYALQNSLCE